MSLPTELEDLAEAGYTSHSYRFTTAEIRWLRRFSVDLAFEFEDNVSHNLLMRVFLRLAEQEWNRNPSDNAIRTLLTKLFQN